MDTYKFLIVENNPTDAQLIELQVLKFKASSEIKIVNSLDAFNHELKNFKPDIILSDFDLGEFTAFTVLSILEDANLNIPCVIISGTVNDEEKVAKLILKGAVGFIQKKNLSHISENLHRILNDLDLKFSSDFRIYEEKINLINKIKDAQKRFDEIATNLPKIAAADFDFNKTMDYIIEDIESSYKHLQIIKGK